MNKQERSVIELSKWRRWARSKISTNGSLGTALRMHATDVTLRAYFDEKDKITQGEYDAYQCEKALEKLMNSNKVCAILNDIDIKEFRNMKDEEWKTFERAYKLLKEHENEKQE